MTVTQLLEPLEPAVGALSYDDAKPLITAVKSGNRNQIETAIRSLEEMLASNPRPDLRGYRDPVQIGAECAKYRCFETEVKARIAALKAIISGQPSDWVAAHIAYRELESAMKSLASYCCSAEAEAAKHAGKLATLCVEQLATK